MPTSYRLHPSPRGLCFLARPSIPCIPTARTTGHNQTNTQTHTQVWAQTSCTPNALRHFKTNVHIQSTYPRPVPTQPTHCVVLCLCQMQQFGLPFHVRSTHEYTLTLWQDVSVLRDPCFDASPSPYPPSSLISDLSIWSMLPYLVYWPRPRVKHGPVLV